MATQHGTAPRQPSNVELLDAADALDIKTQQLDALLITAASACDSPCPPLLKTMGALVGLAIDLTEEIRCAAQLLAKGRSEPSTTEA